MIAEALFFCFLLGDALNSVVAVRLQMSCQMHVEFAYYASSRGRQDVCAYCGVVGAEKNQEFCKPFLIVIPVCADCLILNKTFQSETL